MADYDVEVGVKLDDSKLDSFENRIKDLKNEKLNLEVKLTTNASDITKQLNRQLGGKLNIDAEVKPDFDVKSVKQQAGKTAKEYFAAVNKAINTTGHNVKFPKSLYDERELFKSGVNFNKKERNEYASHITKRLNNEIKALSNMENSVGKYTTEQMNRVKQQIERDIQALESLGRRLSEETRKSLQKSITDTGGKLELDIAKNADLSLEKASKEAEKALKKEEAAFKQSVSNLKSLINEKSNLEKELAKDPSSSIVQKRLKDVSAEYDRVLDNALSSPHMDDTVFDDIAKSADKAGYSVDRYREKMEAAQKASLDKQIAKDVSAQMREIDKEVNAQVKAAEKATEYADKMRHGDYRSDYQTIADKFRNLDKPSRNLKEQLGKYADITNEFSDAANKYSQMKNKGSDDAIAQAKEVLRLEKEVQAAKRKTQNLIKSDSIRQKDAASIAKQDASIRKLEHAKKEFDLNSQLWLKNHSAAASNFGDELDTIRNKARAAKNELDFKDATNQFDLMTKRAELEGKAGLTTMDKLKRQWNEYAEYVGVAAVIGAGAQAFREMARNVLEVDTAMTGLYRVTDMTSAQYDELYSNMISSSKEYGRTLTDTINATSDWVRAGFEANDALGLAEVTAMYQNVSDLDYAESSENLLTAYNGFKQTFTQDFGKDAVAAATHIADVYNEIDNKFSVTSEGLGEGIARSASALEMAGNTFEESVAMIGAISEVTQDPEKAGNGLKTISMRLRGMKGELEALGEDAEGVENISKMQGQILNLTHGKVNIFGDDGQFKSTYDIMMDIADVWKELSSIEQADLLETIAGKHQANNAAALIQNAENAKAMVDAGLDAEGSAAEENARQVESLQGRLNSLMASFQSFSASVLDSSLLKGFVSGLTGVLNILTSIAETIGTLPTLIGAAGAAFAIFGKGKGIFGGGIFGDGKGKGNGKGGIAGVIDGIKELMSAISDFNAMRKTDGIFNAGIDILLKNDKNNPLDKQFEIINAQRKKFDKYQDLRKGGKGRNQLSIANAMMESFDIDDTSLMESIKKYGKDFDFDKYAEGQMKMVTANEANKKSLKSQSRVLKLAAGGFDKYGMSIGSVTETLNNPKLVNNPVLTGYINKGDFSKGIKGLVGANAKSLLKGVGGSLLGGLAGGLASAGVSFAISGLISGIDYLINYNKNLSEEVDNATMSYNEQKKTLSETKGTIDDISPRYEKLAKGVNSITNENVGLTSSEYEEYLSITAQIAEMFPSMVSGYDAQGNAMLKAAGSAEELNKAYEKQLKENNDSLLGKSNKVFSDFKNEKKKLKYTEDTIGNLKDMLDDTDTDSEAFGRKMQKLVAGEYHGNDIIELVNALKDAGLEQGFFETNESFIKRVFEEDPAAIQSIISDYEAQLSDITKQMRDITEAYLSNAFIDGDYSNISEDIENIISKIVPKFDDEYFSKFETSDDLYDSLDKMLSEINKLSTSDQETFKTAFELETKLNNGDITIGEYTSSVADINKVINKLKIDEDAKHQLRIGFGIDQNEIKKQYDDLSKKLQDGGMKATPANEFVKSLTKDELTVAMDFVAEGKVDFSKINTEDGVAKLKEQISADAKALEAFNFTYDVTPIADNLDKLKTAMTEASGASGLTSESLESVKQIYGDLEGYDPAKLFEKTASGIKLNREELNKLNSDYKKNALSEAEDNLTDLVGKYNRLTAEIEKTSNASERAALIAERETYGEKIREAAEYKTALEGLTSAYNEWMNAQSGPEEREEYANIGKSRSSVKETIDQGWLGNKEKAYIDMLSGEDLANAGYKEYIAAWKQLGTKIEGTNYSINDFFTVDENGNETVDGIYNFFDAVHTAFGDGYAKIDKETGEYSFDLSGGKLEEVAKRFKMDAEGIQYILEAAIDRGFKVDWDGLTDGLDLATADFETLVGAAEAAQTSLNKITGKSYSFNFSAGNVEDATSEFEKAENEYKDLITNDDGKVNLEAEGAEEMRTVLAALLRQKRDLESEDTIMSIDVDAEEAKTEVGQAKLLLQDLQNKAWELENTNVNINTEVESNEAITNAQQVINKIHELEAQNPQIWADVGMNQGQIDALKSAIQGVEASVNAGVTPDQAQLDALSSAIQGIPATITPTLADAVGAPTISGTANVTPVPTTTDLGNKFKGTGKVAMSPEKLNLGTDFTGSGEAAMTAKTKNMGTDFTGSGEVTLTVKKVNPDGTPYTGGVVNGTAHANGTVGKAFKHGSWGTKENGVALMGELGQETIVRDGRFFTVGDNGAEFVGYKKGDIIFNHKFCLWCYLVISNLKSI